MSRFAKIFTVSVFLIAGLFVSAGDASAHTALSCGDTGNWGIDGSSDALAGLVIRTRWVSATGVVTNFNTDVTVRAQNDNSIQQSIEGAYGGTRVRERSVRTGATFYIDYGSEGGTPRTSCNQRGYSVWGYGKDEWGHNDWGDTWGLDCFVNSTGETERFTARVGAGPTGITGSWDDPSIEFTADNGNTRWITFTFREVQPIVKTLRVRALDENDNQLTGVRILDTSGNGFGGDTAYFRVSLTSISASLRPRDGRFGDHYFTGCYRVVDQGGTRTRNICNSPLSVSVTNTNPLVTVYALYQQPSYTLRIETTHNFPGARCSGGSPCVSVQNVGTGESFNPLATITSDSPISATMRSNTRTYYYPSEDVSYIFRDWTAGNVSYSTGSRLSREITFSQPESRNGDNVQSYIRANYEILTYRLNVQAIDTHGRVIGTPGDPFDPGVSVATATPDNCGRTRHAFNPGDHRYGGRTCSPSRFTPYTITDILPIPFTYPGDSSAKLTLAAEPQYEASNNVYKFDHFEIGPTSCWNHDTGSNLCGGSNEDNWIITAPYCEPGFCGIDNGTRSITLRVSRLPDEYSTIPRVRMVYKFVKFSVTE